MDTMCFHSSEIIYFLPLIRLGLICKMVEILCFVCSSLWIIKFLWELYFHWIMEYFVILKHVIYHAYHHVYCLPLCNVWEEITNHDNRTAYQTHYIPFDRFHDKL